MGRKDETDDNRRRAINGTSEEVDYVTLLDSRSDSHCSTRKAGIVLLSVLALLVTFAYLFLSFPEFLVMLEITLFVSTIGLALLAHSIGMRWNIANTTIGVLLAIVWIFHSGPPSSILMVAFGSLSWGVLVLPVILKGPFREGRPAYVDFTTQDFVSHFLTGYITVFVFFDLLGGLILPIIASTVFGILYELLEYVSRNSFTDLHFDINNSLFDQLAHLMGACLTLTLMVFHLTLQPTWQNWPL